MNSTDSVQATPKHDKDYELATERFMVEIEHMRHEMAESQSRIERLRQETSGLLNDTRRILQNLAAG